MLICAKTIAGIGSTSADEEGQVKATMDGENQGGHERERHTTRADAGPSGVESTRQIASTTHEVR